MKNMSYEHRFYIEKALKKKVPVRQIAEELGYTPQAVYKEISIGKCEHRRSHDWKIEYVYLADYAQRKHDEKASNRGQKKKLSPDDELLEYVKNKVINEKYSPEASLYKLPEHIKKKVCVKTIYNYIHAGYIKGFKVNNLPYAREKKEKKETVEKRPFSRGRSIEERPKSILERKEYGHWEMDTVYSSHDDKTCLLVLTERMKREELIFQIPDRTSQSVVHMLDRYERKIGCKAFREKFKTITCDNGMEFADWQGIEKSIRNKTPRTVTYFCHPYSSSERGSNENQNRFIRRWIPKGDDIGLYAPQEIQFIQDWLNNYPRKMFGGRSALEV